jgi:hypothetical protein
MTTLQEKRAALEIARAAASEALRPLREALAAAEKELLEPLKKLEAELAEEEFVAALPAYLAPWIARAKEQFGDDVPPALLESLLANIRAKPTFTQTKEEGKYYDPVWTHYRVSYKWAGETIMQNKMTNLCHEGEYQVIPYLKGLHDCYCESWDGVMGLPEKYRWMAILTADYDHIEALCAGVEE